MRRWNTWPMAALGLSVSLSQAMAQEKPVYRCPGNLYTDALSAKEAADKGCKTLDGAQKALRDALAISYAVQGFELSPREYYLVRANANGVQKVLRVPLKEGATVKNALRGAPSLSSKVVWIARQTPGKLGKDQVLPVDWDGISHGQSKATNYALQSGDYLFVGDEPVKGVSRLMGALTAMLNPDVGSRSAENYKPE